MCVDPPVFLSDGWEGFYRVKWSGAAGMAAWKGKLIHISGGRSDKVCVRNQLPALELEPAAAAAKIGNAMKIGGVRSAALELAGRKQIHTSLRHWSSYDAERLELLDAIAGDIRWSLDSRRRGETPSFEGAEVCLQLLEHLAQPERGALTSATSGVR
jgi:hypothetical protein